MPQCSPRLKAVLVVHLHAARVGGNAQEVGDKNDQRLGVGRAEIAVQRCKLVLFGAARIKLAHVAHKNHLEGSHQRGGLGAVKDLEDRSAGQVEVREREVPHLRGHKGFQHGGPAAVQEKRFVAGQHVPGPQRALAGSGSLNLGHKTGRGGKARAPAPGGQRTCLRAVGARIMRLQNTFCSAARPA